MNAQLILSGVGGQGILFATKVLAEAARRAGAAVTGSETHGMSQRGGSVISHLKIGGYHSPLVREATADAVIALDADEAYRALRFLRPATAQRAGALLVANAPAGFPAPTLARLLDGAGIATRAVDATAVAAALNAPLSVNLVILGVAAASGKLPFDLAALSDTVAAISPPRFCELNLHALAAGHAAA
jgi:indolepyruvate ferredoxin oxidoreductase beta subunit